MRPVWKQEDTGTKGLSWGIRPGAPLGTFRVYVGSIASNVNLNVDQVIKYGTWQHLATTFDAGTLKMYVDGQPVASMSGITNTMNTSSVGFRLGGAITPPLGIANQPFNGYFDEVRIFDTALSDSEILALFQSGPGPACWACPGQPFGDATGDGNINTQDLLALKKAWLTTSAGSPPGTGTGQYNCCADFTQDGAVNTQDLLRLKQNWLQVYGACADISCP
jgi:hypothetical protein